VLLSFLALAFFLIDDNITWLIASGWNFLTLVAFEWLLNVIPSLLQGHKIRLLNVTVVFVHRCGFTSCLRENYENALQVLEERWIYIWICSSFQRLFLLFSPCTVQSILSMGEGVQLKQSFIVTMCYWILEIMIISRYDLLGVYILSRHHQAIKLQCIVPSTNLPLEFCTSPNLSGLNVVLFLCLIFFSFL
jgi:hypothetical protein